MTTRLKIYHPRDFHLLPQKDKYTVSEIEYICGITPKDFREWSTFFYQLKHGQPRLLKRFLTRDEVFALLNIRDLVYNRGLSPTVARFCLDDVGNPTNFPKTLISPVDIEIHDQNQESEEDLIVISGVTNYQKSYNKEDKISDNHDIKIEEEHQIADPIEELNELNHLINNVIPIFSQHWKPELSQDQQNIELDMNIDTNLDTVPDVIEEDSQKSSFTAEQIEKIKHLHDEEFKANHQENQQLPDENTQNQYAQLYLTRLQVFRRELKEILELLNFDN